MAERNPMLQGIEGRLGIKTATPPPATPPLNTTPPPPPPPPTVPTEPVRLTPIPGQDDPAPDPDPQPAMPPAAKPPTTPTTPTTPATPTTPPTKLAIPPSLQPGAKPPTPGTPPTEPALPSDEDIARHQPAVQTALRSMRARIEEQNSELERLRKAGADPKTTEELTALRTQLEEATRELDRVALERSPRWKAKYDVPRQNLVAQIAEYLKEAGVEDATIAERAANMPFKERMAFLQENAGDLATSLLPLYANVDTLDRARKAELQQATEARRRDEEAAAQQTAEFRTRHIQDAIELAKKEGNVFLVEIPGDESWNTTVGQVKTLIGQIASAEDPGVQAKAVVLGAVAPMYRALYEQTFAELQAARETIAKYANASPRAPGPVPPGGQPPTTPTRMTAEQAAAEAQRRLNERLASM